MRVVLQHVDALPTREPRKRTRTHTHAHAHIHASEMDAWRRRESGRVPCDRIVPPRPPPSCHVTRSALAALTRLFVCSLSICLRYTSIQKSLQMNLMISSVSVKRGRSRVYRSTSRTPTWKPIDSILRLACWSCEVLKLAPEPGGLPRAICTSSMCRKENVDSATCERALAIAELQAWHPPTQQPSPPR